MTGSKVGLGLFATILALTATGVATAQDQSGRQAGNRVRQVADPFGPHRAMIRRYLDSTNTASLAVAVAKDGKIVWEEGFGWANREKMIPATHHTMYSLASISKPITATGLMVLVERGKVALDQPANQYLGIGKIRSMAGDAAGATVRRVLSHTAGLPLHWQFFYADNDYGPPTMDETISRYGITVFPPGTQDEYSNLGYGILDHIISRASGLSYADFMRNEVFLPLGMTRTSVDIGPGLADFVAERYDLEQNLIPFYTFDHPGASAVYSSAHDLVRFGMFHLKERLPEQRAILTPASLDEMRRRIAPADYGLGFALNADDMGSPRFGHGGGMPGVSTVLALYPNERVAIALLTNARSPVHPEYLVKEIMATLSPRFADSLRARQRRPTPAPPAFVMPEGLVGEWTGTLHTSQQALPMRLVARQYGDIHVWVGDQPRAILNELAFANGRLNGRFAGTIPTDDAKRWAHSIWLDLVLGNGTLAGEANAISTTPREMWSLGSYAELRKR
ncbi:MAG: beta-lactamase family protein [Gemmatimonadetes bacterium]|nr:beta-lactamase family protein [Gemmatimonadota bacterium]